MSEPLRTTPADQVPGSDADREALIERLLLAGLDHYFEGNYEQAVNVWTRVAFLERGHGRARAYIERARGALAERQRQSEELLHAGIAAYEAGDLARARELLTGAIAEGGANETALVFLQRLSRLDTHSPALPPSSVSRRDTFGRAEESLLRGRHRLVKARRVSWFWTIAACAAVSAAILLAAQPIASWLGELPVTAPVAVTQAPEPLPVVRAADMRLAEARAFYEQGRLHDALRVIDEVPPADPVRPAAEQLKADVQRRLLAGLRGEAAAGTGEAR